MLREHQQAAAELIKAGPATATMEIVSRHSPRLTGKSFASAVEWADASRKWQHNDLVRAPVSNTQKRKTKRKLKKISQRRNKK